MSNIKLPNGTSPKISNQPSHKSKKTELTSQQVLGRKSQYNAQKAIQNAAYANVKQHSKNELLKNIEAISKSQYKNEKKQILYKEARKKYEQTKKSLKKESRQAVNELLNNKKKYYNTSKRTILNSVRAQFPTTLPLSTKHLLQQVRGNVNASGISKGFSSYTFPARAEVGAYAGLLKGVLASPFSLKKAYNKHNLSKKEKSFLKQLAFAKKNETRTNIKKKINEIQHKRKGYEGETKTAAKEILSQLTSSPNSLKPFTKEERNKLLTNQNPVLNGETIARMEAELTTPYMRYLTQRIQNKIVAANPLKHVT